MEKNIYIYIVILHKRVILFLNMHVRYLSNKSEHSSSNLKLVRVVSMCFGPSAMVIKKGKLEKQMFFLCGYVKERYINLKKEGIEIAAYLILV